MVYCAEAYVKSQNQMLMRETNNNQKKNIEIRSKTIMWKDTSYLYNVFIIISKQE